jgi:hypothetical protein
LLMSAPISRVSRFVTGCCPWLGRPQRVRGLRRALGGPAQQDAAAIEAGDRNRVVLDAEIRRESVRDHPLEGSVAHESLATATSLDRLRVGRLT